MSSILGVSADGEVLRMVVTQDAGEWLPSEIPLGAYPTGPISLSPSDAARATEREAVRSACGMLSAYASPRVDGVNFVYTGRRQREALQSELTAQGVVGPGLVSSADALREYLHITGWLDSVAVFLMVYVGSAGAACATVDARTGRVLSSSPVIDAALARFDRDGGEALCAVVRQVADDADAAIDAVVLCGERATTRGLYEMLAAGQHAPVTLPPDPHLVLARGAALLGERSFGRAAQPLGEHHAPAGTPVHGARRSGSAPVVSAPPARQPKRSRAYLPTYLAGGVLALGALAAVVLFSGLAGAHDPGGDDGSSDLGRPTVAPTITSVAPQPAAVDPVVPAPPSPAPKATTPPPTTTVEAPAATAPGNPAPPPPPPPPPGHGITVPMNGGTMQIPGLPPVQVPPVPPQLQGRIPTHIPLP